MALSKIRIGKFVRLINLRAKTPNLTPNDISGINRAKEFFEPSKQVGGDTSKYKVVPPNCFACNLMHVGRDIVLPISLNTTCKNKIVSPAYTVFDFIDENTVLKKYFFIYLISSEKDRFFWFHTDSSIRDGLEWKDFCNLELEFPPIPIQKKYVAIYESMQANLKSYEKKLDDLKLVCDGFIEDLRRKNECKPIFGFLNIRNEQNSNLIFKNHNVLGVSQEKTIIPTKANTLKNDISKFTIIHKGDFVYNPRNGIAIALCNKDAIISWNNTAFYLNSNSIVPEYLMLWFLRKEWNRKVKFDS